ncbi:cob(I)yrinic acid a,c-diamide adenosyltransferase [Agarivorans sp. QJM3NY_29]|uniref:cob(I)yrinic acid a,c-diamide adenosyltransferase n=1 Tax=unclassified Agarivorans TaxID=2636026 RepID=UPI003D7D4051
MSIYTKKGDAGSTSLVGGVRVHKSDIRVDAYGTVDELNASLSLASKAMRDASNIQLIEAIEHQLFYLGAEVASADNSPIKANQRLLEAEHITAMEQAIDRCMSALPPVNSFVLPGSSEAGSRLHVSRTIARRAERRLVELAQFTELRPLLLKYINRLSDLLYAIARFEDQQVLYSEVVERVIAEYLKASTNTSTPDTLPENASVKLAEHSLGFVTVHRIMQQAVAAALKHQVPIVIAVVDQHGNMIMSYRMPDALLVSSELAPKKAYSAIALKSPTHQLSALVQPGQDLYQLETICDGKIVTFGGGFPLYQAHQLIGAIGISGGSVTQDIDIALAAIHGLDLEDK